jgi:hypothetical protein
LAILFLPSNDINNPPKEASLAVYLLMQFIPGQLPLSEALKDKAESVSGPSPSKASASKFYIVFNSEM